MQATARRATRFISESNTSNINVIGNHFETIYIHDSGIGPTTTAETRRHERNLSLLRQRGLK